jgi:hypothetical protein
MCRSASFDRQCAVRGFGEHWRQTNMALVQPDSVCLDVLYCDLGS